MCIYVFTLFKVFGNRKVFKYVYVCVCMGTKTISITDDAYKRLLNLKKENESFSMVINRVTGKTLLSQIQGILSEKTADELERNIKESRKKHAKLREARMKRIKEAFS